MQTNTQASLATDVVEMMNRPGRVSVAAVRQTRRLPERILIAAHQACDLGALDVATQLLSILETYLGQQGGTIDSARRRSMESLLAAYERIWHLRHDGKPEVAGFTSAPDRHDGSATAMLALWPERLRCSERAAPDPLFRMEIS